MGPLPSSGDEGPVMRPQYDVNANEVRGQPGGSRVHKEAGWVGLSNWEATVMQNWEMMPGQVSCLSGAGSERRA